MHRSGIQRRGSNGEQLEQLLRKDEGRGKRPRGWVVHDRVGESRHRTGEEAFAETMDWLRCRGPRISAKGGERFYGRKKQLQQLRNR